MCNDAELQNERSQNEMQIDRVQLDLKVYSKINKFFQLKK
jgi:hypothetical protein